MRRALQERVPVAPDAITHTVPETCVDLTSGRTLTPAEVLQSLVDKGIVFSDRDPDLERCLLRNEWNQKFRKSDAMVVSPDEGLICWAGALQSMDVEERGLQEFALLAQNTPAGQAEATKILHNLMRHPGNWNTDATGWIRRSIQDSTTYLHEWRAHEGTRPPPRTWPDLRIPEAEVEEPLAAGARGRNDRDAWKDWRPSRPAGSSSGW